MLFTNYLPWCVYQFSLDRLHNKIIHSKENLRIVCYNCNSSGNGSDKMSCSRGCHTVIMSKEKEDEIRTKRHLNRLTMSAEVC